jgi:DNA polymerase IV
VKILHLDLDSFFATAEQQARPSLRGRPVGIAIANSPGGTIIGSSMEAKRQGVGTATRIAEAKSVIPDIVILPPNPARYRVIHARVREVMSDYTPEVQPRSIDEIAIWLSPDQLRQRPAAAVAAEIKRRIRTEIGDWISSSIGIGPNWWLAKTGSDLDKPDGVVELTRDNTRRILAGLQLTDLCGIARRLAARFTLAGIPTPVALYDLPPWELKRRLGIIGYYWHRRLHGYAIDTEDRPRRTIGHSSVIPRPTTSLTSLKPLLGKLCERAGRRLRKHGLRATEVSVFTSYRDHRGGWGSSVTVQPFTDSATLFGQAWRMLSGARLASPVRLIAVRVGGLVPGRPEQLELWPFHARRQRAVRAFDTVNDRWGELTLHPAGMMGTEQIARDSIAFGQDMMHPAEEISPRAT